VNRYFGVVAKIGLAGGEDCCGGAAVAGGGPMRLTGPVAAGGALVKLDMIRAFQERRRLRIPADHLGVSSRRMRPVAGLVAAWMLLAAAAPAPSAACGSAWRESGSVEIAQEEAVVIWDEEAKTEHFIRRASFRTEATDFGFLVPTPARPELADAPDDMFASLDVVTRPQHVYRTKWSGVRPTSILLALFYAAEAEWAVIEAITPSRCSRAPGWPVNDAVVLAADSATALADWLGEHGYAKRPALAAWLAPYVEKRWKLTAFKIADAGASTDARAAAPAAGGPRWRALTTAAVRMTFKTDRPFFPYREPRDQGQPEARRPPSRRALRIFFLGRGRAAATIAGGTARWPGETRWAAPFTTPASLLPMAAPRDAWLTLFEDSASPRPGAGDLYFDVSGNQQVVEPRPIVHTETEPVPLPLELPAAMTAIGFFMWRRRARARQVRLGR
jgi:hypothetical protein